MDIETTVRAMLDLARLDPPDDEVAEMVATYPTTRSDLDALYAMPGLPATDPALVFRPTG